MKVTALILACIVGACAITTPYGSANFDNEGNPTGISISYPITPTK